MSVSTVNISFQEELLDRIDRTARAEARSRSELIREAARLYIERKQKWESIFSYGESLSRQESFTEADIAAETAAYRKNS